MNLENSSQKLYCIGLSYKKADVNMRSKFSISKENQILLLKEAKSKGSQGTVVLSTCNRTEIMGFASHPFELISLLCKYSEGSVEDFVKVSAIFKNDDAIDHLFRIATGLESQILGDYEIVSQLKKAFKDAKKQGTLNAYLERLSNLSLQASKEVKSTTKFSSGIISVSYVAVQYALTNVIDFNTKNVLVLGLGDIGKNTCKNILQYTDNKNIKLINRTLDKAERFGNHKGRIEVLPYEKLEQEIPETDVLIVSTSAEKPIVTKAHLKENKEVLILDLSIPKNVNEDVAQLPNVTLVNVDTLSKITDETLENRKKQIPLVEEIIAKHKNEFLEWLTFRKSTPAINTLKNSLETIKKDAISLHLKKHQNLSPEHAEEITSLIVNKIVAKFAMHLKDDNTQANLSIQVMEQVFK